MVWPSAGVAHTLAQMKIDDRLSDFGTELPSEDRVVTLAP